MIDGLKRALTAVERLKALDPLAEQLQRAVAAAFAAGGARGRTVQDALSGVWLGHPLHPVLTDLPIGCWTATLTLDTAELLGGQQQLRAGSDLLLGAGVVSAVGTALSGLADWQFTSESPRRVGLVHALLNSGALLLSIYSLLLRRRGARSAGRLIFAVGYGVASVSGYLGGHLLSVEQIGTDHATIGTAPGEYTAVLKADELPENQPRCAVAGDLPIVLVRQHGQIFALANRCAHLGGPLAEGTLEDASIRCPWHGSRFALADGRTLEGPSAFPQRTLLARAREGKIEVRAGEVD